jgi:Holliday junction DNA helicase RuvA
VIAFLRGIVAEKGVDGVVMDVGGVGYAVTVTAAAHRALPPPGGPEVVLHVYTHAVQDGPLQLFGFVDQDERRVFETLLAVQGVGPKVAVAILSGLPLGELVRAISAGDLARLTQIRGVGRKTAERLCVELREKIGLVVAAGAVSRVLPGAGVASLVATIPPGRLGEVHGALLALGFKPSEFEALLPGMEPALPAADLIKQALAALRRK